MELARVASGMIFKNGDSSSAVLRASFRESAKSPSFVLFVKAINRILSWGPRVLAIGGLVATVTCTHRAVAVISAGK